MTEQTQAESISIQALELARTGQFQSAVSKLDQLGEELKQSTECLYIKAVCLRKLNRLKEGLSTLDMVLAIDAEHARAFQEMGHSHIAAGNPGQATVAFAQAVRLDSALIGSWRALVALYEKAGNQAGLQEARAELSQLEQLPPALQAVKSHLNRDNIETADQICRHHMQQHKQDVEGMRLLAEIANRAKILDDAEFILESAVAFKPDHIGARYDYGSILLKRQKFGAAHEVASKLSMDFPDNKLFKSLFAATLSGIGDTEHASRVLRELIAEEFNLQHAYLLLGHTEKTIGNLAAAIKAYQQLYHYKADFGDAFWSLANTKTYKFTDAEIAHMEDYRLREETSAEDKVHFNFALGKAYEDQQEYAAAFSAYESGNRLNKQRLNYKSPEIEKRVARQINVFTTKLFADLAGVGASAADPIFVVGLPRAGSTLLEQILASHSSVDGTLELPNILSLTRRLRGRSPEIENEEPQYPQIIPELEPDYFRQFGEQYINDTMVYRQGAEFFIDKMPNNFLHIGLIKLILPNAKVIDARRHPMACCFSGFKQLFAEGQEFSYGLKEIGHHYKNYVEVMDHWDRVLPGYVLRVQHEDVVNDLEGQVRRMLEFCDLPFEQNCLEFHKTERNVRTPSSEQVRQPIYKTGLEQWRNFEAHLDPLIEALGPEILERYPIN